MKQQEAKTLLGFPPHSDPSTSQVKSAYRKKVWETHPDRFGDHEKQTAECKFKLVSEAYNCLQSGRKQEGIVGSGSYSRVVRTGTPRVYGSRANRKVIMLPFIFIIVSTFAVGGSKIARAYKKEQEAYPSNNPFLP
ncbi:hypothetical protein Leryth_004864 [Lithospermum erythrorhizon]|nr:hypothetical protein Leryth_004864 [Lithospermum erythrorhizon]